MTSAQLEALKAQLARETTVTVARGADYPCGKRAGAMHTLAAELRALDVYAVARFRSGLGWHVQATRWA